MEQWRLFLAIILSIFVFFLWEVLFVEPPQPPPGQVSPNAEKSGEREGSAKNPEPPNDTPIPLPEDQSRASIPEPSFDSLTIQSSLYTARISMRGASLTSFVLSNYREDTGEDAPQKELIPEDNVYGTALVHMAKESPDQWFDARYATDFDKDILQVKTERKTISFFWEAPRGAVIEKRYTFVPDSYRVKLDVVIQNPTDKHLVSDLVTTLQNPVPADRSRFAFEGPFAFVDGDLKEIDVDDIGEESSFSGTIEWTGLCDRYFMTTLVPEVSEGARFALSHDPADRMVAVNYMEPVREIPPGTQDVYHYALYMGPKQLSVLRQYDDQLSQAVNFGFFDIIAKPCLWLMNAIHDHFVPNYGVAIILLTILFKIVFWPLGTKSYRSMAEMKKLQPLMAEIRKKYKDDKKKMNEEVMRLYKTYKVNPMSGCLPMVVQIPVFIAFYRMLYEAIELRHAPFMLWINDLSAPDRLFHFDVSIPLMIPPYGIPVLTIIMGATMFLQQKLSPPPGDPSQAKFMMMMPLIFTVIFINFPSGLVLYWLVNNLISIGQQYYITKKTV